VCCRPGFRFLFHFKALFKSQPRLKSEVPSAELNTVAHHMTPPLPLSCSHITPSIKTRKKPLIAWIEVGAGGGFVENQTSSGTHKASGQGEEPIPSSILSYV